MASATVGALRVELSADSAQFKSGLDQASGMATKFGAVLGTAAGAVAAFGAAAAAAAAVVVVQMRKVIDSADDMGKVAQKVGLMTEELSALKYTADLAGVGFESLQANLIKLTRSMSEVAQGGDNDAAKAFTELGIAVQNADGTLKSSSQVMEEVADKFATYSDGAEKTALAIAMFGRAGAEMIPLLNQGGDAIRKANEEAKEFGVTINSGMARDSERFNDNLSRMGYALNGIFVAITSEAIPALANLSDEMVDWIKKAELFKWAGELMRAEIEWLRDKIILTAAELRGFAAIFESFTNLFTKPIAGGIGGMMDELRRGFAVYGEIIDAAKAKTEELKRSQSALFNPFTHGDVVSSILGKPAAPRLGGGGGAATAGGGSPESEYDAEKARIEARLTAIREGLLTEEETKYEAYQKDLMAVEEALNKKILMETDAANLRLEIEKKFQADKQALQDQANTKAMTSTASFLGSIAKVTESWGKKNNAVSKALGIAQALINTYVGATEALKLPFPANLAAFAAVVAKGLAAVAAITAVNPNGGSGGRASLGGGGGGGAAQQAAPAQSGRSMYVSITGDVFNREMLRGLLEKVSDFQKDGGGKVVFA